MSYLVSLLFWILVACGGIIGSFETSKDTLFSIYAHLLITIFIIVDLFIHEHEIHKFSLMLSEEQVAHLEGHLSIILSEEDFR